jgi:hypothetical protein
MTFLFSDLHSLRFSLEHATWSLIISFLLVIPPISPLNCYSYIDVNKIEFSFFDNTKFSRFLLPTLPLISKSIILFFWKNPSLSHILGSFSHSTRYIFILWVSRCTVLTAVSVFHEPSSEFDFNFLRRDCTLDLNYWMFFLLDFLWPEGVWSSWWPFNSLSNLVFTPTNRLRHVFFYGKRARKVLDLIVKTKTFSNLS